jgi:hypothetical protein
MWLQSPMMTVTYADMLVIIALSVVAGVLIPGIITHLTRIVDGWMKAR